ncbi:MAG: hypothetical protein ABI847_01275, partial [Anaerolineales bacterium]
YNFETDEETMADSNDDTEMPLPADIPDWLKALAPVSPDPVAPKASQAAADEPATGQAEPLAASSDEESFSWLEELKAQAAANKAAAGEADVPDWLATAASEPVEAQVEEEPAASLPPWAEPHTPGPSDTIVTWLARKRTEEDSIQAAPPAAAQPEMPAEPSLAAAPEPAQASLEPTDISAMDSDAAFAWLESLAARQGANPDELLGETAVPASAAEAEPAMSVTAFEVTSEPVASEAEAEQPAPAAEGYAGLPDWLRPGAEAELEPDMLSEAGSEMEATAEDAGVAPETAGYAGLPDWLRPGAITQPEDSLPAEAEPEARAEETAFSAGYDTLPDWLRPGADAEAAQSAEAEQAAPAAEGYAGLPDWLRPESAGQLEAAEPASLAEPADEASLLAEAPAAEPASLPDWLREMEATMPVEPLIDTAPSKARRTDALPQPAADSFATEAMAPEPFAGTPEAGEPMAAEPMAAEPSMLAQADAAESDEDAAMRWLEGLAAQQGANAEELFTEPETRPLTPPSWITAEQMRALETPEPAAPQPEAPEPVARAEPTAMDPDEALRWLESLNARQPAAAQPEMQAEPEEAPAEPERPAQVAAWFAEAAIEAPSADAELPAQAESEAEAVEAEPPEWLKAYVEAEPAAEVAAPAAMPTAPEPEPDAFQAADVDKLARLSERLAATRGLREQEAEARFAEQRERDEEARRLVQERMEARWALEAAEAARPPAAAPTPAPEPMPEAPAAEKPAPRQPAWEAPAAAPVPAMSSEALTEIMASWTQRVEAGHDLHAVIREMESVAPVDTAPVPVVQLLGDAYVRANQLQKALDTYRQALRRL